MHHYFETDKDQAERDDYGPGNPPRYELRTGKFWQYFYDRKQNRDLPLAVVVRLLNEAYFSALSEIREQLRVVITAMDAQREQTKKQMAHLERALHLAEEGGGGD